MVGRVTPADHPAALNWMEPVMPATPLPMLRNSERRDFKRCPQRWWWTWRDGLTDGGPPNVKLWFGTGWHLVMAHWYKNGTRRGKEPLKVWRDWIGEEMPKIRVNMTGLDNYNEEEYIDAKALGEEMLSNYFDLYGRDPQWSVIQVEKPFQVVITNPDGEKRVLFCGTYDGVYRDMTDDTLWLLEHKTAKAIYTGHLTLDDQAGSYLMVATRELRNAKLIGPRENIKGIMYNFARKAPADPRPVNELGQSLNQDGTVSKRQPTPNFVRIASSRTVRERNAMVGRIQAEVEHMEAMRSGALPVYKTPTRDCSWDCLFYNMCVMHEGGGQDWVELRDYTLKTQDPYADHRKSAAGDD